MGMFSKLMDMSREDQKKKELWISHGGKDHSYADRHDCMECINIEIEYLQELKKAGGQKRRWKI